MYYGELVEQLSQCISFTLADKLSLGRMYLKYLNSLSISVNNKIPAETAPNNNTFLLQYILYNTNDNSTEKCNKKLLEIVTYSSAKD